MQKLLQLLQLRLDGRNDALALSRHQSFMLASMRFGQDSSESVINNVPMETECSSTNGHGNMGKGKEKSGELIKDGHVYGDHEKRREVSYTWRICLWSFAFGIRICF